MNKTIEFNTEEIETSRLLFNGKLFKLIYTINVPSTASIWWKNYKGFDNVKLFPENELSLAQEINYIKKLCDSSSNEPLLIITKSPFILQEFTNTLVSFAKLNESSVTQFIKSDQKTLGEQLRMILIALGDITTHPQLDSSLKSIRDRIKNGTFTDNDKKVLVLLGSDELKYHYDDMLGMYGYSEWKIIKS